METHLPTRAYQPRTAWGLVRRLLTSPRSRTPIVASGALLLSAGTMWTLAALGLILGALAGWLPWITLGLMWAFLFALMPELFLLRRRIEGAQELWGRASLVPGSIEEVRALGSGELVDVTYRYTDGEGRQRQGRARVHQRQLDRATERDDTQWSGAALLVAYDTQDSRRSVVPAFEEDAFEVVRRDDRRPALGPGAADPAPPQRDTLSAALSPEPITSKRARRRKRAAPAPDSEARLEMSADGLRQHAPQQPVAEVRWDQPFSVATSVWVVSDREVDLHVKVRQRGLSATAPSVLFSVRLPQEAVDRNVPVKEEGRLAFLDPESFGEVWQALCHNAALRGEPVRARLMLGDAQRQAQQVALPAVAEA